MPLLANKRDTLGNVALQLRNTLGHEFLLVVGELADRVDLLSSGGSELDAAGEEGNTLLNGGLDVGALGGLLATNNGFQERVAETKPNRERSIT